jgi:hypothetical protein
MFNPSRRRFFCRAAAAAAASLVVASRASAMIKCPFCAFENEDGALFCEQCKSDLSGVVPLPPPIPLPPPNPPKGG